ncbi:MAG: putative lipid II flippase FtsW [Myxococcaceae bacterium]|nr:putative lipid II flippase FtsW [Myxococcaceae bacterium]
MRSDKGAARITFDPILLAAVMALITIGLVMVYSASAILAHDKQSDSFFFLKRQVVAFAFGLCAMATVMALGYRRLARLAYPIVVGAILLMILVLVPGIGGDANGASRWIRLPGFSLQPSECLKVAWIIYLSYSLAKKREKVVTFSVGFLPHVIFAGILAGLCLLQKDFGSAVCLLVLLFSLLFTAGAKISYLVASVLAALPVAYHFIASEPYRLRRITAFLDPWGTRHGDGYQVAESLMSIGSGGLTGLGLGDGRQKLFFLPEAHTDFIFSIVGEELGLIGVTVVVVLYVIVVWRGLRAALGASEPFGTYLGMGITTLFAFQAVVNMSVAMGLLPTKGLTLPFISYGGTSLVMMMTAAGVLLSVSASAQRASFGHRVRGQLSEAVA